MKCNNIPLLWRIFLDIANNRDFVNNYCNRPLNRFDRHCREWYLYNLIKDNTEIDYNNNLDNNFNYGIYLGEDEWVREIICFSI